MFRRIRESWESHQPDVERAPILDDTFLSELETQNDRGCCWLRFTPRLEYAFRNHLAGSGRGTRTLLFLIFGAMTLTLPLTLTHMLGMPDVIAPFVNTLVYIQAPIMLVGAIMVWHWPLSRWVDHYCIIVYLYCVAAELAERSAGAQHGFHTPLLWVALATTALLVAMRIRFWHVLPFVIIASIAAVGNEALFVATNPHDFYEVTVLVELIIVACVGGYSLEYFIRKTWVSHKLLQYRSHHDSLTGILNRQAINHATQRIAARARRERQGFGVAMLDVDFFKSYNDAYGHNAGDEALCDIANTLHEAARRPDDFCGRFGGEEFVLVWSGGKKADLRDLAETVRYSVETLGLRHAASIASEHLTVSIGLYCVEASEAPALARRIVKDPDDAVPQLFDRADKLLYQAKTGGRNRVVSRVMHATSGVDTIGSAL